VQVPEGGGLVGVLGDGVTMPVGDGVVPGGSVTTTSSKAALA